MHTHTYVYIHMYTIIYMASGTKLSIIVPRTQLCRIIEASAPAPGSPIPLFVRSNFVKVLFVCIVCLWVSTRHSKGVWKSSGCFSIPMVLKIDNIVVQMIWLHSVQEIWWHKFIVCFVPLFVKVLSVYLLGSYLYIVCDGLMLLRSGVLILLWGGYDS